jgi:hypothetical protein
MNADYLQSIQQLTLLQRAGKADTQEAARCAADALAYLGLSVGGVMDQGEGTLAQTDVTALQELADSMGVMQLRFGDGTILKMLIEQLGPLLLAIIERWLAGMNAPPTQ